MKALFALSLLAALGVKDRPRILGGCEVASQLTSQPFQTLPREITDSGHTYRLKSYTNDIGSSGNVGQLKTRPDHTVTISADRQAGLIGVYGNLDRSSKGNDRILVKQTPQGSGSHIVVEADKGISGNYSRRQDGRIKGSAQWMPHTYSMLEPERQQNVGLTATYWGMAPGYNLGLDAYGLNPVTCPELPKPKPAQ